MQTIIVISTQQLWETAQSTGIYTQSTIEESLQDVGYIHGSMPEQTLPVANRHFLQYDDLILLCIDHAKVLAEVKYELSPSSGQMYPHIFGPLNIDAVYATIPLQKDESGQFLAPDELQAMIGTI